MRLYFTLIFLFFYGSIEAQIQHSADSILELAEHADPVDRVKQYINIADLYLLENPIVSLKYSNEALILAQTLNEDKLISEATEKAGGAYLQMRKFDFAEKQYQKALDLSIANKDDQKITENYCNLGWVYFNYGDLEKSKEFYSKALNIAQDINDTSQMISSTFSIGNIWMKKGDSQEAFRFLNQALVYTEEKNCFFKEKAKVYNSLGVLFSDQGKYTKSLEYYQHAESIYDSLNDQFELGKTYNNMGTIYWYADDYETAQLYYEKSLSLRHIQNDTSGEAYVLNNLGMLAGSKGDFALSLDYFKKSNTLFKNLQDRNGCRLTYYNLGEVYYAMNESEKAELQFNQSLKIAQKDDILDYKLANLKSLTELYKKKKNFKKAFEVFSQYAALNDSAEEHSSMDKLIEMEASFDQEKQKTTLSYLKQRVDNEKQKSIKIRWAITLVFFIFLSSSIALFFIFRKQKLRAAYKKYQLSQQFLQYQMNPSFIHQSLNYIRDFLYKNKAKEAGAYLSKFSRLIRAFIEHSSSEQINLETEIETIEQYFKLCQMGNEDLFSYQIEIDQNLEPAFIRLPPFLLFPLIDVLLGRFGLKNSLRINLSLKEDQNQLSYKVSIDFSGNHFLDIEDLKQILNNIAEATNNRIGYIYKLTKNKIGLNYYLDTEEESKKLHIELRMPMLH